jgi:uncharacterized Zn finger protein
MKMYSPTPECGACESRNVVLDSSKIDQDEVTFYRCKECGELTPNFDDEEMFRMERDTEKFLKESERSEL